jgi:predicted hydrocarbon binding protein
MAKSFDLASIPESLAIEMDEPRTRGLNLLAALAYVRAHGKRDALSRVLTRLPERDLALLLDGPKGPVISARAWYPLGVQIRLLHAIDDTLGNGDQELLHEVGYQMAKRDISRVFRPFFRRGHPGWIIEIATKLWRTYHDRGRWTLERTPVSILATLSDHPGRDAVLCRTFMGWMHAALDLGGAKNVDGAHPVCIGRGASHCVFVCRYEAALDDNGHALDAEPDPPSPRVDAHVDVNAHRDHRGNGSHLHLRQLIADEPPARRSTRVISLDDIR